MAVKWHEIVRQCLCTTVNNCGNQQVARNVPQRGESSSDAKTQFRRVPAMHLLERRWSEEQNGEPSCCLRAQRKRRASFSSQHCRRWCRSAARDDRPQAGAIQLLAMNWYSSDEAFRVVHVFTDATPLSLSPFLRALRLVLLLAFMPPFMLKLTVLCSSVNLAFGLSRKCAT